MTMNRCVKLSEGDTARVLKENLPFADLIIVDGGKGHIEAVREVVEDEFGLEIPVAGLAKDDKHRTSQLLFGNPLQTSRLDALVKNFIYCKGYRMKYTVLRLLSIGK